MSHVKSRLCFEKTSTISSFLSLHLINSYQISSIHILFPFSPIIWNLKSFKVHILIFSNGNCFIKRKRKKIWSFITISNLLWITYICSHIDKGEKKIILSWNCVSIIFFWLLEFGILYLVFAYVMTGVCLCGFLSVAGETFAVIQCNWNLSKPRGLKGNKSISVLHSIAHLRIRANEQILAINHKASQRSWRQTYIPVIKDII